jgi:hypothetical protein
MSGNQWSRRPRRGSPTGRTGDSRVRTRVGERNRLWPALVILEDGRLMTTVIPVMSTLVVPPCCRNQAELGRHPSNPT